MAVEYNPFTEDIAEMIIVSVGRLVEPKGFDLAISAAGNLNLQKLMRKGTVKSMMRSSGSHAMMV